METRYIITSKIKDKTKLYFGCDNNINYGWFKSINDALFYRSFDLAIEDKNYAIKKLYNNLEIKDIQIEIVTIIPMEEEAYGKF